MANLVCDRTPCEYMQAAIHSVINCHEPAKDFSMIVSSSAMGVYFSVSLRYCPFCGTRIDPQWVKNYQSTRTIHKRTG